jgi:hypothetical protein
MVKKVKPDWGLQEMVYRASTGLPMEFHIASKTTLEVGVPSDYPELGLPAMTETQVRMTRRYIGRIMSQLHACYAIHGPDEAWPGAKTNDSYYIGACGMCSFQSTCDWWAS